MNKDMNNSREAALWRSRALAWLAVAAWAAVIFYFSSIPSLSTHLGIWDTILRKIAHMAEFGILGLLLWHALRLHGVRQGPALPAAAIVAVAYAGTDEFHQMFVSGRNGSIIDVGIDLAGICLVLTAFMFVRSRRLRRQPGLAGR